MTAKSLGIHVSAALTRIGDSDRVRLAHFIAALGSAAAWPVVARAQGARARRICRHLIGASRKRPQEQGQLAVFRDGLRKLGWLNGQNIQIETLWRAASIERATAFVAGPAFSTSTVSSFCTRYRLFSQCGEKHARSRWCLPISPRAIRWS